MRHDGRAPDQLRPLAFQRRYTRNAAGSVLEREQYEPFGASGGSALTRYGYTGRERDGMTGLVYNRARQAAITKELMEIIGGAEALKE